MKFQVIRALIKKNRRLALKLLLLDRQKHKPRVGFRLDKFNDDECLKLFRFTKSDVLKLRKLLEIPFKVICGRNGTVCHGVEGIIRTHRN